MSSAVIWTDWASQLSNKDLSRGKDLDKPEGSVRACTDEEKWRERERERDANR